jgi:hypothetical protein
VTLVTSWGCGDGVGRPILGDGWPDAGAAGSGGVMGGAAGSSGGITSGAGSSGMPGGAPSGGMAGMRREGPPPGGGLAPSSAGGFGGDGGDRSGGGYPGVPPSDVPPGPYCAEVSDWDPGLVDAESAIYDHLNFARMAGFTCSMAPGDPPPPMMAAVPAVVMDPALRCAARLHSKALSEGRNLGIGPEDRMRNAGAVFRVASESVDQRPPPNPSMPPYDPILAIFHAGGSRCDNLMDERFTSVGIGVYRDFVTLDFTGP